MGEGGLREALARVARAGRRVPAPVAAPEPLTGLATREEFAEALEGEPQRADRAPSSGRSAVLVLDLDGFKLLNDRLGHAAGDEILVEVAWRLQRVVAQRGLLARTGGDEFAVLARDLPTKVALRQLVEELRRAIVTEPIVVDGTACTVSVTIGATVLDGRRAPEEALRRADERMYLEKRRAGADAFDRASELIVGLLDAGDEGLAGTFASGIAEVAGAHAVFVDCAGERCWWPERPEHPHADALSALAAEAHERDDLVEGGRWQLAAPLRAQGEPIGAFAVARPYPFAKADRIALTRAGAALGQASLRVRESVAARRRISELEHLALHDECTGVANRRALLSELERLQGVEPLSLLFVDFDGLRAVNNRLSYEHGNELLRLVTATIGRTLWPGELAARLHGSGGDEFVVVCPGVEPVVASRRAAELEQALGPESIVLPPDIGALYGGGSVGYAVREPGEGALELVERAAALMRSRKQARKASAPG
jgi:diguanylate cyclase (GGDEF)-like protein